MQVTNGPNHETTTGHDCRAVSRVTSTPAVALARMDAETRIFQHRRRQRANPLAFTSADFDPKDVIISSAHAVTAIERMADAELGEQPWHYYDAFVPPPQECPTEAEHGGRDDLDHTTRGPLAAERAR